ncbi:MAG: DUF169 domain-containing protein [Chloroflexi bacterium]|nr:DUF169 domain-containing protein [Chloroflexota bacterium]
MNTVEKYRQTGQNLYSRLHLATYPVAIKYIKDLAEIPAGSIRPTSLGQKASLCQAFTYARRWAMSVAMTADDNFCTPATAMHRWVDIPVELLLQSQLLQQWHKNEQAERKRIDHGQNMIGKENLPKLNQYIGFACSPLNETQVEPDTVLIYGTAENITHIVHALTYEGENYPTSSFEGFAESCLKGGLIPFITGVPQIVVPGMGDRSFSGTYDYEIAIGIPADLIFKVDENLFLTGGPLNMGQPVRTLLPQSLTEAITPGFVFMREKIDEHKDGNTR